MDINCDLGEGEPLTTTRRLLRWVTSANIACGGHAGSVRTMRACLKLCKELGVSAGAHPGFADRENLGRKEKIISLLELEPLIASQVEQLARLAKDEKIRISHIKLHGALYHLVERDRRLATGYVIFIKKRFPGIRILVSPKGYLISAASRYGVEAWGEIFSDRAYAANGNLMSRNQPGAILEDLAEIRKRMETFRSTGRLPTGHGKLLSLLAQTVCVHADSPNALRIARLLAGIFRQERR
ncbi:MAG TPA: 5-oxoprolinase subunit PxpA [Terrimicrobiaceae bacterium]